ncbi:MAG: [FeFe] hydrogenase H-cluster radical SAM maturase HydE [Candidatus Omnitrophica bacterium]|nr:[FeFe] hydrogenase H-cluster radical SAM maturase HydE [Candidatus Omnitrophota bacterium]
MDKKEIIERLKDEDLERLFKEADDIRKIYVSNEVHIRGIIEFSNHCCRSCLYCGLRRENERISRYRMKPNEIISLANQTIQFGVKTVVLQSGDDLGFNQKALCQVIGIIKKKNPEVAVTLSVGERPLDDYRAFKEAGADRYLLKHETANPTLYDKLHPGQDLKTRLQILDCLRRLGYQIGLGNIAGLPGQTVEDLADDILLMKNIEPDMAGVGPFIPQKDTPLSGFPYGNLDLTLKVLALTRIVTKNTHLPATTALATLNPNEGQFLGLKAGCNVIMPDFTPEYYRKNYIIYDDKVRVSLERAKELIFKAGRFISKSRGNSLKCKKRQKVCVST